MCKVKLVLQAKNENEMNEINYIEINKSMADADQVLASHDFTLH